MTTAEQTFVRPVQPISTAVIGMTLFLFTEAMFFAGLIGSRAVLKAGDPTWIPPRGIQLPVYETIFNTFLLLCSAATLYVWKNKTKGSTARHWLEATALLGVAFLVFQGREWFLLLAQGFQSTASLFAATFYVIVGSHAVHVLGGVLVLAWMIFRQNKGRLSPGAAQAGSLYWSFVVGIWPILYVLVYWM